MKIRGKLKRSQLIAGAVAALALTVVAVQPAAAVGSYTKPCSVYGQYTRSSNSSTAQTYTATGDCGTVGVRANYTYNGVTYWTPWSAKPSYVSVSPGYTVLGGEHYTSYTSTATT